MEKDVMLPQSKHNIFWQDKAKFPPLHIILGSNTHYMVLVHFVYLLGCLFARLNALLNKLFDYSYSKFLQSAEFSLIMDRQDLHFFHI
jgi:hypothetical protein